MRSSKSRSRGNKTRNIRPSGGNIINRVFESSGPDGKVRGTPAQIIEKYTQLHRDAQLSGDRVNAENFSQHAEHYTRILAEAQREIDKVREEQEQFNRDRQAERDRQVERDRERQAERQNGQQDRVQPDRQQDRGQQDRSQQDRSQQDRSQQDRSQQDRGQQDRQQDRQPDRQDRQPDTRQQDRERERQQRLRAQEDAAIDPGMMEQPELPAFLVRGFDQPVIDAIDTAQDSGLVETPEARDRPQPEVRAEAPLERSSEHLSEPRPRTQAQRQPRAPRPDTLRTESTRTEAAHEPTSEPSAAPATVADGSQDAAPAAEKPRAPRPRKPKPKPEAQDAGPAEAAE